MATDETARQALEYVKEQALKLRTLENRVEILDSLVTELVKGAVMKDGFKPGNNFISRKLY